MAEKTRCELCDRTFKDAAGLEQHNAAKHTKLNNQTAQPNQLVLKGWKTFMFVTILVLIIAAVVWSISSAEKLPPTDIDGHIERNPPSRIMKEPMPIAVQKHMLEHAEGVEGGRGGVIINYNCESYTCELDLVSNLEAYARKYPYVYVAPFKGMDAKIALTKLNKIEVLDDYDEEKIKSFIN